MYLLHRTTYERGGYRANLLYLKLPSTMTVSESHCPTTYAASYVGNILVAETLVAIHYLHTQLLLLYSDYPAITVSLVPFLTKGTYKRLVVAQPQVIR